MVTSYTHDVMWRQNKSIKTREVRKLQNFFIILFICSLRLSLCLFQHDPVKYSKPRHLKSGERKREKQKRGWLKQAPSPTRATLRLQTRPTDVSRGRTRAIISICRSLVAYPRCLPRKWGSDMHKIIRNKYEFNSCSNISTKYSAFKCQVFSLFAVWACKALFDNLI